VVNFSSSSDLDRGVNRASPSCIPFLASPRVPEQTTSLLLCFFSEEALPMRHVLIFLLLIPFLASAQEPPRSNDAVAPDAAPRAASNYAGCRVEADLGVLAETAVGPFFFEGSVGDSGHRKWFFQLGRIF
jgi:hypothetical protein